MTLASNEDFPEIEEDSEVDYSIKGPSLDTISNAYIDKQVQKVEVKEEGAGSTL